MPPSSIFLVLAVLVTQASAAAYTGTYYASGGIHTSPSACPAGSAPMTSTECDALSAEIVSANSANAKYVDFRALHDTVAGSDQSATTAYLQEELQATSAEPYPTTISPYPSGCWVFHSAGNSWNGRIYYNSASSTTTKATAAPLCTVTAGSSGDPHLRFANGGRADFRGKNNTDFALLSVANLSLAGHVEGRDFLRWNQQIVSGSFFTQAFITVRTAVTGAVVRIAMIASEYRTFRVYHDTIASVAANGTAQFEKHTHFSFEGVEAEMQRDRLVCRAHGWKLMLIPRYLHRPILGTSLAPVGDASHWFLDTSMEPLNVIEVPGRIAPHGVIGQSYDGSGKAVDGKIDEYPDASLFVTYAQAEGAIEGSYSDYALASPFSTDFKYSRFDAAAPVAPRNVSRLTGKVAPAANGTNGAAGSFEPEDLAIEPPKLAAPLP